AWRDALGGLATVYRLAHELPWTCDCREAPRPCAADSRRLCPLSPVGTKPTINECLRAATNFLGSCIRYKLPSSRPHFGCAAWVMVSSANSTKATLIVLSVPDDANDIGRGCFGFSFLSKLEPSNTRQPA